MLAAANGYADSVSLLIGQGCNVLAHDLFQRTALHGAVSLTYFLEKKFGLRCMCVFLCMYFFIKLAIEIMLYKIFVPQQSYDNLRI